MYRDHRVRPGIQVRKAQSVLWVQPGLRVLLAQRVPSAQLALPGPTGRQVQSVFRVRSARKV